MSPIKKELAVVALSDSVSQPNSYALILEDMDTNRRIPIIIGVAEAQAIAVTMERMQPARPLTHDLMKNTLDALAVKLKEVLINSLIEGVFHAVLILEKEDNTVIQIDSRTSDAIALAVRFNAPIVAYEHVIEEAGILSDSFWAKHNKGSLADYSLEDLEDLLKKVVEKEDYESAVRIREVISRRKNEQK
jgi:uncharacterized protein